MGVLKAKTDAWGKATFDRDVATPFYVHIAGKPAQKVEWR
jgi:hypothetical protein